MNRLEKAKEVIKENFSDADCGLFFTNNSVGDTMFTIYEDDEIIIDICYSWSYFEVFGLTEEEEEELKNYYEELDKEDRKKWRKR